MKIFLTGGTGYIGGNFINHALKQKHTIYAVSRKKVNAKKKNLTWLKGPIEKSWKELKNSDVLIHLASEGVYDKYSSFKKCFKTNVVLPSKLLHNAIKSNCLNWIIIGSCTEKKIKSEKYAKKILKEKKNIPYFNYAFSKYLFTKFTLDIAKKHGAKCRVLRLFHVYGNNESKTRLWPSLINATKKKKDFQMTKGDQIRDFCHIDNVVFSLLDALNFNIRNEDFPQLWDFATGKKKSVKKFAREIWKKYGYKGKLIFNKIKNYDNTNYIADKKYLWKIKS
jgi:nucleoside-diphosphate-sugar epimerase